MTIVATLDGKVDSIVPVTNTWSKISGSGTATFEDAHDLDTRVELSAASTYVLRLTSVTDGDSLSASDDMTIVTALNVGPATSAGADFSVLINTAHQLAGSATDTDGFPVPHSITYKWTKVSGTGTVSFADSTAANTTVTIDTAGSFVLRLTAYDGGKYISDDVTVTVTALPGTHYVTATPSNPSATLSNTDVEYRVDLSVAGAPTGGAWWGAMVNNSGADIRVTDSSNVLIPFDVVYCTKLSASTGKGLVVYKRPVGTTGAAVRIWVGASPAVALSANDPNGQYAAYRSDCLCFYPDGGGSGTSDRTSNAGTLTVVGAPTVTSDNSGPIGSNHTTYSSGKYAWRLGSPLQYDNPGTFSAAIGVAITTVKTVQAGGFGATSRGAVDSDKNTFSVAGALSGSDQIVGAVECGNFSSPVPVTTAITTALNTYYHYSGTCASSGASRTVVTNVNTNTSTTAVTPGVGYDAMFIGAFPRLTPSSHSPSGFCTINTPIGLVSAYSTQLTTAHLKYQGTMLDQATFYGSWTYV